MNRKSTIVEEITQTLVNVLNKKPEHIHIVIDELMKKIGFCRNVRCTVRGKTK